MSRPYFQFELDAGKKASTVADGLNIHRRQVMGGLALMWMHLYETKTDEVTAFMLQSFFGLEASVCAPALVAMGFLAPAGDAWRARGVKRYTRLTETRQEAGRKGAEVTNAKRRQPRGQGGKFVAANADPPRQVPRQTPQQPRQVPRSMETVDQPVSHQPTVNTVPTVTAASAAANTAATAASAAVVPRSSTAATAAKSGPISEIRDSLSFRERENLRDGSPAQRESHAPPPGGAGRDSRTGTSEGTRGETPAVPESTAPAPRPLLPSRKPTTKPVPEYRQPPDPDPIESRSWLWDAHEMPRKAPPDDEWVNAVVWRLKRLTRVPDAIVRKSEWPGVQANVEHSYLVAAEEAAGMVPGIAGLVLLGELDDREQAIDGGFAADLIRWLRERAEHLEPIVERERQAVDQGEEVELVH